MAILLQFWNVMPYLLQFSMDRIESLATNIVHTLQNFWCGTSDFPRLPAVTPGNIRIELKQFWNPVRDRLHTRCLYLSVPFYTLRFRIADQRKVRFRCICMKNFISICVRGSSRQDNLIEEHEDILNERNKKENTKVIGQKWRTREQLCLNKHVS